MITANLQGGLGNQMFQIVAAYAHARKHNDVAVFNLNTSQTFLQGENISKYKNKFFEFTHLDNVYTICNKPFVQPGHSFCHIPYEKNQQLQGYFQSEKFFINVKEEIINKFIKSLKTNYKETWNSINNHLNTLRTTTNSKIVALHIRRGDYLKNPHIHPTCPVDYYLKGLKLIENKIGKIHPYFISDDIAWCKKVFTNGGSFSSYSDEMEDLMLMINCDHNIIANSSFSWWGAYLNVNPNPIIISPCTWFGPAGPQDQEDTVPESWIKI